MFFFLIITFNIQLNLPNLSQYVFTTKTVFSVKNFNSISIIYLSYSFNTSDDVPCFAPKDKYGVVENLSMSNNIRFHHTLCLKSVKSVRVGIV